MRDESVVEVALPLHVKYPKPLAPMKRLLAPRKQDRMHGQGKTAKKAAIR